MRGGVAGAPRMQILVGEAYSGYRRHLDLQLAAALAFFSSLALPPVVALALAGAEAFFGRAEVRKLVYDRVASTAGPQVAQLIGDAVESYGFGQGSIPALLGTIGLFIASVGLVYQAQLALRHVFEIEKPSSFRRVLRLRGLGLAAVAVLVGLVVALFGVLALLGAVGALGPLTGGVTTAAVAATTFVAASLSYRWLSGHTVPWPASMAGGAFTTVVVLVGRSLLSVYLSLSGVGSAYGSVATVFVLLMWLYALAAVYLLGAEVARAWMVASPTRS
jgi:membrane protein